MNYQQPIHVLWILQYICGWWILEILLVFVFHKVNILNGSSFYSQISFRHVSCWSVLHFCYNPFGMAISSLLIIHSSHWWHATLIEQLLLNKLTRGSRFLLRPHFLSSKEQTQLCHWRHRKKLQHTTVLQGWAWLNYSKLVNSGVCDSVDKWTIRGKHLLGRMLKIVTEKFTWYFPFHQWDSPNCGLFSIENTSAVPYVSTAHSFTGDIHRKWPYLSMCVGNANYPPYRKKILDKCNFEMTNRGHPTKNGKNC